MRASQLLLAFLSGLCATLPAAAELPGPDDGWHSWSAAAADGAPELCCFRWADGVAAQHRCNLDSRRGHFGMANDGAFPADEIRVYAMMRAGQATQIRVLSANCPVTSDSPIVDLGTNASDDSVRWLASRLGESGGDGDDAITAIAMHDGELALDTLVATAREHRNSDVREQAIFWMAQVRIDDTAGELREIMFDDADPEIREHAAFAWSQSAAADRSALLARLGREDRDPDVRGQAWFWLAQSGVPDGERRIVDALDNERDDSVREAMVFAMSQLPEDRAVSALGAIVEDRRQEMAIREQALFWLAQTESDEAFELVERLLTAD